MQRWVFDVCTGCAQRAHRYSCAELSRLTRPRDRGLTNPSGTSIAEPQDPRLHETRMNGDFHRVCYGYGCSCRSARSEGRHWCLWPHVRHTGRGLTPVVASVWMQCVRQCCATVAVWRRGGRLVAAGAAAQRPGRARRSSCGLTGKTLAQFQLRAPMSMIELSQGDCCIASCEPQRARRSSVVEAWRDSVCGGRPRFFSRGISIEACH